MRLLAIPIVILLAGCVLTQTPAPVASNAVSVPSLAPTANTTPAPYHVTAETLNVRTGPGVDFDSVAILYRNELVHVYRTASNQDGSTWGEVAPGRWVNVEYIERGSPAE
jgi:uncharacterized protein YgiM (DUF1202 family)